MITQRKRARSPISGRYYSFFFEKKKLLLFLFLKSFFVQLVGGQHSLKLTHQKPLLYSNQNALPRLPVPHLAETCRKYLNSVKPLLSPEEYKKMEDLVAGFLKKEGRKLQFFLVLKSWFADNYVSDWWEKYVYLRGRSPLVINSNYYILDSGLPNPPTNKPVARAANLISITLEFKALLDRELINPMFIRGAVPMCMAQYERIFSTTRIPGKEIDTLEHDDYDSANHIAVYRKGFWYAVEVYDQNGNPYPPHDIEIQLKWIMNDAEKERPTEAESSLAALTTENRTTWANAREEFFSSGLNKQSLNMIENAIFVVCFEDENPDLTLDWTTMGRTLFHGNGKNRWCDKSFSMVIFPNGKAGLHVEHSWADAPVMSHVWEYVVIVGDDHSFYDENGFNKRTRPLVPRPPPTRLRWDLTQKAEKVIETALTNVRKLIDDIDLVILTHDAFGKGLIKRCGVSPDAFVQMAMQIAYKRDRGQFGLTYESSMTRLFRNGRTETVRPVTLASAAFVNAMEDPSISKKDKIKLLKAAAEAHQNYYRDCMSGNGIDRHLFALYVVSQGLGVDSQFLKSALSMEWKLSTSQQPQGQTERWNPSRSPEEAAKVSPGGGFGPVSDDGYGVSYMIAGEEKLSFHISSKKSSNATNSARLGENIFKALSEMKDLFDLQEK